MGTIVEDVLKLNDKRLSQINKPNKKSSDQKSEKKKILYIPEKDYDNDIVFNFLTKKCCIDEKIVTDCLRKGVIYQTKDIKACAFVGFDKKGKVRNISLRRTDGAYYKNVYGSLKTHTFKLVFDFKKPIKSVYVFENPIDALSHATILKMQNIDYKNQIRLTLSGVSRCALDRFLKDNESIEKIILCLNNDKMGIETMDKFGQ